MRDLHALIAAVAPHLAAELGSGQAPYEAVDSTVVPTRNLRRRARGWLAGWTDKGKRGRIGWHHGFHLLVVATPDGIVTGFGAGPASIDDRKLAEQQFAARRRVAPGWPPGPDSTTSAPGSIAISDGRRSPLPTSSPGECATHTKRWTSRAARADRDPDRKDVSTTLDMTINGLRWSKPKLAEVRC